MSAFSSTRRKAARPVALSDDEARALAMAYELYNLLGELSALPQHRRGSRVEAAWDYSDEIISVLSPEAANEALPRLVVTRGTTP